jgi:hypothetical protein
MNEQSILDQVKIASPCHARWEDMAGDDRSRFCGQCSKNVFNFSAMTRAEVETLIREKEGRLCGRFFQRADGRMLTADCPVGVQRRRSRLARIGGTVFATVMFLLGGRAWLRSQETQKSGNPPPGRGVWLTGEPAVMGDVAVSPLMGRIAMPTCPTNAPTNAPPPAPPRESPKQ